MSTRKPKSSLPYPTDLPEKRLQLVSSGDKPRKTSVQPCLWTAEESASQDSVSRSTKSRLH